MSGAAFGRKGAGLDADLAARRAAFLAAERARPRQGAEDGDRPAATGPAFAREKSLGTAYLLWFFLGGLSAHRFYLGFPASAAVQLCLSPLGYALLIGKSPAGFFVLIASGLWILADAFLIPGMIRKANARGRGSALGPVFA